MTLARVGNSVLGKEGTLLGVEVGSDVEKSKVGLKDIFGIDDGTADGTPTGTIEGVEVPQWAYLMAKHWV